MSTYNWTDGEIVNAQKLNAYGDGIDQAREEILNATANPPKIQNGTWWTWDTATNTYVNTNVPATGQVSVIAEYQLSDGGTTIPTGTWSTTIPTPTKGKYLWTRNTYNDGTVSYSVAYNGVDGTGAVVSVNGQSGAVVLKASDVGAKTSGVVNLFVPISATQTDSGVTCTNNGDGTYTLNGTATANQSFLLHDATLRPLSSYGLKPNTTYKLCGCPPGGDEGSEVGSYKYALRCLGEGGNSRNIFDFGNGATFNFDESATIRFQIQAIAGNTYNNLVFKPMITESLDAVYDDFVPFGAGAYASNPNLLDNPFFTVNQRGKSTYPAGAAEYTVDRWKKSAASEVSVLSDGINFKLTSTATSSFSFGVWEVVDISRYVNKTVTMSVWSEGSDQMAARMRFVDASDTFIRTDATDNLINGITTKTAVVPSNAAYVWVQVGNRLNNNVNATVKIKACKLELGPVSTLSLDHAPDYATELLKCQRYFVAVTGDNADIGFGHMATATLARIGIPIPTTMRGIPTVSVSEFTSFRIYNTAVLGLSSVSVLSKHENQVVINVNTSASGTQNSVAILKANTSTAKVLLSADL